MPEDGRRPGNPRDGRGSRVSPVAVLLSWREAEQQAAAPHSGTGTGASVATRPAPSRPSRRLLLTCAALLLVALVAAGVSVLAPSPSPSPSPAPEVRPPAAAVEPAVAPGLSVVARLAADGTSVEVVERQRWPADDRASIELQLSPQPVQVDAGTDLAPVVRDLQVRTDGAPARVTPSSPGEATAWLVQPASSGTPRVVEASYVLEGALLRSDRASPGRGLVVVAPLMAALPTEGQGELVITDEAVLSVACRDAAGQASTCGTLEGSTWTAALSATTRAVLIQVELPTATGRAGG